MTLAGVKKILLSSFLASVFQIIFRASLIWVTQVKTGENEDEWLFFSVAEGIFVVFFTLEYLVRLIVSPQKVMMTVVNGDS